MSMMQSKQEDDLLSLMNQSNDVGVSLPYAGTSGWSGTDTSKSRTITRDSTGDTATAQRYVMDLLYLRGEMGATWKEISELTMWHHGTSSGTLSVLHKSGKIARLLETRARCRVYVLPRYICNRETDSQGRKPKPCPKCGHVND